MAFALISHAYFCFVPGFCSTCKHAEVKLNQNSFTETNIVLFQFHFRCNHGLKHWTCNQWVVGQTPTGTKLRNNLGPFVCGCAVDRVDGVKLNEDQMKIVDYVRAKKRHLVAPLVVYGAFGTGKTEALAKSAILLASSSDNVKLLICTQTNS